MMKKKYFSVFISFLIIATLMLSCANKKSICTECVVAEGTKKTLKLELSKGTSVLLPITYWYSPKNDKHSDYHIGDTWTNETVFNGIVSFLKIKSTTLKKYDKMSTIVLYFNENVNGSLPVTSDNIKGFSVYSADGKVYKHDLFHKIGVDYVYVENKTFSTNDITHNDIYKIVHEQILKNEKVKSYLIVSGNMEKDFSLRKSKYSNAKTGVQSPVDYLSPYDDIGCNAPCQHRSGSCARLASTGESVCKQPEDCFKIKMHKELMKESHTEEALHINFPLSYQFRDNFLKNHAIGLEYIHLYYELGNFLLDKYNLSIMLKTAFALRDCNIIMTKLLDEATYGTEIAITAIQKNVLLDLIADYKALSNDQAYQSKLNRIENDLNNYAGITVSNLKTQLN